MRRKANKKEDLEMIEAVEEIFKNIKEKVEEKPEGLLVAFYVPNVSDKAFKKFDNGEGGIKGCSMIKADCNDNTIEVGINALEGTKFKLKAQQEIKNFFKKLMTINEEDEEDEEDED